MSAPTPFRATGYASRGIPPNPSRLADLSRFGATTFAGSAHGEQPVVNRQAGACSASGSTPPSSVISRFGATKSPRTQPAGNPRPVDDLPAGRGEGGGR